jgi:superfamily II DNA or RNA helicase
MSNEETIDYNLFIKDIDEKRYKFMTTRNHFLKIRWLRAALDLKNWMADIKFKYAKEICDSDYYKSKRTLTFSNSINQANEIGADAVIHSKMKENPNKINLFNEKKINSIVCVNMLKEAINLHHIELGLIVQLDNQILSTTQTIGRILRADDPELIVLMLSCDQDKKYVRNNLHAIAGDFITTINYEKFKNDYKI